MAVLRFLISTWTGKAVIGVIALALVGGIVIAPRSVSATPAQAVRTVNVARGNVLQTVAVSGSLNAYAVYKVGFRVSGGKLADVPVRVGQTVTAGTVLARLDTTDLENSLKQAQVNLVSAQAKYDQTVAGATAEDIAIGRNSVDSAKRTFELTQKTTQSDIANAEATLTKVRTSYASAKDNFASQTGSIPLDADTYLQALPAFGQKALAIRGALEQRLGSFLGKTANTDLGDAQNARNALLQSEGQFALAVTTATTTLRPALVEYADAVSLVSIAENVFDRAVANGADTTPAITLYQQAQSAYQTAASHLTTALDTTASQLGSAQTSVNTAATALNGVNAKADATLEQQRLDVTNLLAALTAQTQVSASVKAHLTQATGALTSVGDAVGGSYANAKTAVDTARDKATQSLTQQENAVTSAQLSFAKTSASPKQADIAVSYASVQLAQLALDKARQDLDNATLRAPVDGVVSAVANGPGETPVAAFVTIAVVSSVILHGTVGESDIAKLRLGQVATVAVDAAGTGTRLTGKITGLDPVATIAQGVPVYGVDVQIDLSDAAIRPGMSGTAAVIVASAQGVLTVPNLAIRTVNGQRQLQVMRNGQAEDAQVTFGLSNDTVTEVKSGLGEGDVVVIPQARAGASARPQQGGGFGPGGGGGGQPVIIRQGG